MRETIYWALLFTESKHISKFFKNFKQGKLKLLKLENISAFFLYWDSNSQKLCLQGRCCAAELHPWPKKCE